MPGCSRIAHPGARTVRHAKAIDYSLKRWAALTRYLDDGDVPIDNNWVENQIRPIASGARTGCSPAAARGPACRCVMSLIQSAKLNGHDPYAYLKDVLRGCRPSRPAASGTAAASLVQATQAVESLQFTLRVLRWSRSGR
jgi:hypothetical protein